MAEQSSSASRTDSVNQYQDLAGYGDHLKIDLIDQTIHDREGFEVAAKHGRQVLDSMRRHAHKWLNCGGRMMTIATSLLSWRDIEQLPERDWHSDEVFREVELELIAECGPPCIDCWLEQQANDGEQRIYQRAGKGMHKLWFIKACK